MRIRNRVYPHPVLKNKEKSKMRIDFVYTDETGENIDYTELNSVETAEEELLALIEEFNRVEKARYGDDAVLRTLQCWMVPPSERDKKVALKKKMDDAYNSLVNGPGEK